MAGSFLAVRPKLHHTGSARTVVLTLVKICLVDEVMLIDLGLADKSEMSVLSEGLV